MATLTYAPGCVVSWTSNASQGNSPARLPKVLHADTIISLAPSVGTANVTIADPDGRWVSTIKPNDQIVVTFTSYRNKAKNLGQLAPGDASAWTGLVDHAWTAYDPRTQYGRACQIKASTMWKPLVVTAVPLQFFFNAQYPQPGLPLLTLLSQAVFSAEQNLGISVATDFGATSVPIQTSYTNYPSELDVNDPQSQSWAAYLMSMLTAAGVESYAREDGAIVVRDFQGMQNPAPSALLPIPPGLMFASSGGGVSDENLLTNVVVSWSAHPASIFGAVAPDNGLASIGPLPPQLCDASGAPLPQIGKRFASYTADFINSAQDAERYASNARSVGLAGVDRLQASVALDGDVRVGSFILTPCYDRRYYVTTVGHFFEDQVDAETTIQGNFGAPTDYAWDQRAMRGAYTISVDGQGLPVPSATVNVAPANLPLPADPSDPDTRWLPGAKVVSAVDIAGVLQQAGSPFADQAASIWSAGQKYGINPAFALAVFQEESGLGANPNAVTDIQNHNPASIGVTSAAGGGTDYGTWAAGTDAFYALIAGQGYYGSGRYTVAQIAAYYDQPNAASWASNVTALMLRAIRNATVPAVSATAATVAPPGATGTVGAMAQYAATLAQSIPAAANGVRNVLDAATPLGAFAQLAGYATVQCTTFVEYLLAKVAKLAGIVTGDNAVNNGPNASLWGGSYLPGLGFTNETGNAPLPADVLLFSPGEANPPPNTPSDLSEGDGHVGVIVAVSQPDSHGQGGSITLASANVPDPVDTWTLTRSAGGVYAIGGLTGGRFFGATPLSWWRHS